MDINNRELESYLEKEDSIVRQFKKVSSMRSRIWKLEVVLESIPRRFLKIHDDLGATGGWNGRSPVAGWWSCKDTMFENMTPKGQFSSSIQSNFGDSSTLNQLTSVIIFRRIFSTNSSLFFLDSSILIKLLCRILLLSTPDSEGIRNLRRPWNVRNLVPWEGVLPL